MNTVNEDKKTQQSTWAVSDTVRAQADETIVITLSFDLINGQDRRQKKDTESQFLQTLRHIHYRPLLFLGIFFCDLSCD